MVAALTIAFVIWGFVGTDSLSTASTTALGWVMNATGWAFVLTASIFVVFVLWLAASRFGNIPLGKDGEKPAFKTWSWISMMFAAGMGIGLMFWGAAEPLYHYVNPPPGTVEGQTAEAARIAMATSLFHWTLHPWAMYAVVGMAMGYGTYRMGRRQLLSDIFTPLFGKKVVNGAGGKIINMLAIFATLFGSAASLGLGAIQIASGLQANGAMAQPSAVIYVVIIAVLTCAFVASAVSGIERGIQWLSNINMVLAAILAFLVFVAGPTIFILNVIPTAVGEYFQDLPGMASRTAASGGPEMSAWLSSWTIFYWAWWISWTPFVGMFIARISRGRTIRQFVCGVLLVPSAVSLLWFAIFGGSAIGLQAAATAAGTTTPMVTDVDGVPTVETGMTLYNLMDALNMPSRDHRHQHRVDHGAGRHLLRHRCGLGLDHHGVDQLVRCRGAPQADRDLLGRDDGCCRRGDAAGRRRRPVRGTDRSAADHHRGRAAVRGGDGRHVHRLDQGPVRRSADPAAQAGVLGGDPQHPLRRQPARWRDLRHRDPAQRGARLGLRRRWPHVGRRHARGHTPVDRKD